MPLDNAMKWAFELFDQYQREQGFPKHFGRAPIQVIPGKDRGASSQAAGIDIYTGPQNKRDDVHDHLNTLFHEYGHDYLDKYETEEVQKLGDIMQQGAVVRLPKGSRPTKKDLEYLIDPHEQLANLIAYGIGGGYFGSPTRERPWDPRLDALYNTFRNYSSATKRLEELPLDRMLQLFFEPGKELLWEDK